MHQFQLSASVAIWMNGTAPPSIETHHYKEFKNNNVYQIKSDQNRKVNTILKERIIEIH